MKSKWPQTFNTPLAKVPAALGLAALGLAALGLAPALLLRTLAAGFTFRLCQMVDEHGLGRNKLLDDLPTFAVTLRFVRRPVNCCSSFSESLDSASDSLSR